MKFYNKLTLLTIFLAIIAAYSAQAVKYLDPTELVAECMANSGHTNIRNAVECYDGEALQKLVDMPSQNINAVYPDNETLLSLAMKIDNYVGAKILLKSDKIAINQKDYLNLALSLRHKIISCMLLDYHPDININARDQSGLTSLELATKLGYKFVVSRLLKRETVTAEQGLPLKIAIENSDEKMALLLLRNPEIRTEDIDENFHALTLATQYNLKHLATKLERDYGQQDLENNSWEAYIAAGKTVLIIAGFGVAQRIVGRPR